MTLPVRLIGKKTDKKRAPEGALLVISHKGKCLYFFHVGSLKAFLALLNVKGHCLTFCEGFEPVTDDGAEVNKNVWTTVVLSDKAKALLFAEPLYRSGRFRHAMSPEYFYKNALYTR